jgi:hypothetical protein
MLFPTCIARSVFVVSSLTAFIVLFPQSNQLVEPASVKSQEWRLVRLFEMKKDGAAFVQSGVAMVRMNRMFVVTCLHFVDKVDNKDALYADFKPPIPYREAKLVWSDKASDLAILETEVKIHGVVKETITEPYQGKEIVVIGFDDDHLSRTNLNIQKGTVGLVGMWATKTMCSTKMTKHFRLLFSFWV